MRTLIIGLPLPNAGFDNYSFLSAPSFGEYQQLVVDVASVTRAVDDVINGAGVHATYGGQAIVNGPASSHAFSLREIVQMRRRETERLLANGGLVVLIGYPPVPHDVQGAEWKTLGWLPEPDGFSFERDLLPGFGTAGAVVVDAEHPFAPYVETLAPRLAYRVYVNEDVRGVAENGLVFARSSGGVAIGVEIGVGGGRLVVLPPLVKPEADRPLTAQAMAQCLDRWNERRLQVGGETARKEVS